MSFVGQVRRCYFLQGRFSLRLANATNMPAISSVKGARRIPCSLSPKHVRENACFNSRQLQSQFISRQGEPFIYLLIVAWPNAKEKCLFLLTGEGWVGDNIILARFLEKRASLSRSRDNLSHLFRSS